MRLSGFLGALLALSVLLGGPAKAGTDPVAVDPNTGANFNRYAYASNNPYRFVDPDGRQSREFNFENHRLGVTPPPRSERDWLGPAIGYALTGMLAAPVGAHTYLGVLANPIKTTSVMVGIGEAAGVTGMGVGLMPRAQPAAVVATNQTTQALSSLLRPNGQLVGNVVGGATPEVRTVSPATFGNIRQSLSNLGAVEGGGAASYRGTWYSLPDGQGGFGVRNAVSGPTLDLSIPGFPKGFKVHQGE